MLAKIGNIDITELINESSYKVESSETYESWKDGNYHEHRRYIREQVSGSFDVVLGEVRGTTLEEFRALVDANSVNHLLTILVHVNNTAAESRIEAYCDLKVKTRRELSDGTYMETVTVTIKER